MKPAQRFAEARRGAVVPLLAILLIPLIAMMAFSVDLGYMVVVNSDAQNAADSAALAGAQTLQNYYVLWTIGGQTQTQKDSIVTTAETAARQAAKDYAGYNVAAGTNVVVSDGNISFGYFDGANAATYPPPSGKFPNTVKVQVKYDGTDNPSVKLFFGQVIGVSTLPSSGTAAATMYVANYDSLQNIAGVNGGLLPFTYDVNDWKYFLQNGKNVDNVQSLDANGFPQLKIYPSIKDTGNFGELSLDANHAGASQIKSWIDNGVTSSDISSLSAANLIPLSAHDATKWDWVGNPGFKASTVMTVNDLVGHNFVLPLFTPYADGNGGGGAGAGGGGKKGGGGPPPYSAGTGQGSNYYYQIVKFVMIKIMPVSDTNKEIVVQPVGSFDNVIDIQKSSIKPAGEETAVSSGGIPTFTTAKLTQ